MEVAYEPYSKISFQSYILYEDAEAFASAIALGTPPEIPFQVRLFWANGILFRFFAHPPSEALAQKQINGHIIWDHIELAPMPERRALIDIPERPLGKVSVLDVTSHAVFGPLTAWIRDNLIH
jgi:hypothetical protein